MSVSVALDDSRELFATLVASGAPYVEAAEAAGFARDTGKYLMRQPEVRARVDALVGEPDKARLSAKYWLAVIRTEAALEKIESGSEEWRQTMALHLNALDKLARYRGWIVEKKQIARATLSLDKLTRGEIHAHLGRLLDELEPGARAEMQRMIDAERFTPR